jgi:diguanylate cyclase (GGDEF)-like protein/PAS domain S-box-containing protein
MTSPPSEPVPGPLRDAAALGLALQELLDEHPSALVFALDEAANRVPLPADDRFAGCHPLPGQEATGIDYVVPADRLAVGRCWQRARAEGVARTDVRLAHRPERVLGFAVVDSRHRHGVWIALLFPYGSWADGTGDLDPVLVVPSRPRTGEVRKNLYGVITDIDERASRMLGWAAAEMVGRSSLEFVHPEDHERAVGQWLEMRARRQSQRIRLRHRHRDGHWLWVEVENVYAGLDRPDEVVAVGRLTDVSEEMAAIEAVRQQERLFRRLAESLPGGVCQIDEAGQVVYANARLATVLGVPRADRLADQLATVEPGHRTELLEAVEQAVRGGADRQLEVDVLTRTGDPRRCLFTVAGMDGEGRPGAIMSVTDVTDSARLREQLRIKATYDALTGLLNRAVVLAELERALTEPDAERLAVLFVDLDRFKSVNDTHGHAVGDQLLCLVARRLTGQARRSDLIGRIGGDEFLLVCPGVADRTQAMAVARRVHDRLHGTFVVAGIRLRLAASVGVVMAGPRSTADQLVAGADEAMYRAKKSGGGPRLHPA